MDSAIDELRLNLASKQLNLCRIRSLSRSNPGLIETSGLRVQIWTALLLGCDYTSFISRSNTIESDEMPCIEQHVLDADVNRTRADIEEFRSSLWRDSICKILKAFCLKHQVQYKQGMNEVLAPFLYLCPPTTMATSTPFKLFEAFIFRYLERYFFSDESVFLFRAFRLFHLLLLYHDPQLALHLHDCGYPPELYSPQWFLTLFSRALPIHNVLRLWDIIVTIDDPAFTFFLGLSLLRRLRDDLLHADATDIPEVLKRLYFSEDGNDIDFIASEAIKTYATTPRCICRNLRLCCVSTSELAPMPKIVANEKNESYINRKNVAIQSRRSVFMFSTQELVSILDPIYVESSDNLSEYSQLSKQIVIIDMRPAGDTVISGGGLIPRAIALDPSFLDHPDAFDHWLQHFDETRGCTICIIDFPPCNASSVSLWRRLIYGEGDGISSTTYNSKITTPQSNSLPKDYDSEFAGDENQVDLEEASRPSIRLAKALQRASFPHVSVLDGGFPTLVEFLRSSRGSTEPVVLNHQPETWQRFAESTGREHYALSSTTTAKLNPSIETAVANIAVIDARVNPRVSSQLAIFESGLKLALKLGHKYTAAVITAKVEALRAETAISGDGLL